MVWLGLAHEFEGHVDRIEDGWIVGWGWTPKRPAEPIQLEVFIDGASVSRCTAELYRPDLERAGKGDGRHAFEIALPAQLRDGGAHEVRVVFEGTDSDLIGSPSTVRLGPSRSTGADGQTSGPSGPTYRSHFGGLWTDLPNANQIIEG
jgi:hypothetical protein